MRIACLQFSPQVGDVKYDCNTSMCFLHDEMGLNRFSNNLNRADAVLNRANPMGLDLLVLPELAFTGCNFISLSHITPYLEPTTSGTTSLWARTTALKYECDVTVGYPEKVDVTDRWPASPEYNNSAITVNADGETIANYRKTFLDYRDKTWALEGTGFYEGVIPGLGNVAMGICMDLNPYNFEDPRIAWEFAYHVLHYQADLVIIPMAWSTRQNISEYSTMSKEPDMETLLDWVARLEPVVRNHDQREVIVVLANCCGKEGEAFYAGTSCVIGIKDGSVKVYGILGRGERELLVVDTLNPPQFEFSPRFDTSGRLRSSERLDIRSSVTVASENRSSLTSISSSVQSHIPIPEAPTSPRAGTPPTGMSSAGTSPGGYFLPSPQHPPQQEKLPFQVMPLSDWDIEHGDQTPDSASSMRVNTPWDSSPRTVGAEDIIKIMKATSRRSRSTD